MDDSDKTNQFVIHDAIKQNNTNLAKQLIDQFPKELYSVDEDERTPLHWACTFNNLELVEYILSKKASDDVEIDELVDSSGWTPLHIVSSLGNIEIFNRLLELKPDLNEVTNQGTTCLHLAISKNNFAIVEKLIENGANCKKKDKTGHTPLHRASSIGSIPTVKLLCEKGNINVNAKDNDGWTALHHALAEGHADVAVELVGLGADPQLKSDTGELPIHVAVDDKVKQYFLSHI
ncbi:NAS6 [[Candida] subhashii]|uniref:NAS6 n=1 Tax=[Candida] subhashii TaxID=561895 RepID=A0A8J5UU72_9ASCO|nr:NAS6 [[Candida] subhashii]KAG7660499.1 NAS6 [[Candida] subhashii]